MSYEGSEEYICEKGHYTCYDCNDSIPSKCSVCYGALQFHHAIDYTNGTDKKDPGTYPAPRVSIGFEDVWCKDHYGTKYAVKQHLYKPNSPAWKEFRGRLKD
jgi:hypothetical protein